MSGFYRRGPDRRCITARGMRISKRSSMPRKLQVTRLQRRRRQRRRQGGDASGIPVTNIPTHSSRKSRPRHDAVCWWLPPAGRTGKMVRDGAGPRCRRPAQDSKADGANPCSYRSGAWPPSPNRRRHCLRIMAMIPHRETLISDHACCRRPCQSALAVRFRVDARARARRSTTCSRKHFRQMKPGAIFINTGAGTRE